MSRENVEIVRAGFDAFNQGGPDAASSDGFWSPEIVWDTSPSGIPGLGVYHGYDEVKSALVDNVPSQPSSVWAPKTRPGMLTRCFARRDRIRGGLTRRDRIGRDAARSC